jgi:ribosomal protein S6--L-glutamate ligase
LVPKLPVEKIIIGRAEWCQLPELNIPAIKARVDSGAKTSALHAFNIEPFVRDGVEWVSFEVHPLQRSRAVAFRCEATIADRRMVKSTSGVAEQRYVIKTTMCLGAHNWEIELTLTNRDSMGYRMLLGRQGMKRHVLIDPAATQNHGRISDSRLAALYADHL